MHGEINTKETTLLTTQNEYYKIIMYRLRTLHSKSPVYMRMNMQSVDSRTQHHLCSLYI